jgi:tripartite-type tricarboxylate transporter receptor subunit TctC
MLLLSFGLVACFADLSSAFAQSAYPARPIRIVVPTAAGGGNDLVARILGQALTERWGRQVVVENRTGAGTMIGNEIVAKSKPDGYTLLMAPAAFVIIPAMYKKVPYDTANDFTAVIHAVNLPALIAIHPSVPASSLNEMIALARARPGELAFASAGYGTQPHLSMELLASMAQIKMIHVPYKGTSPGLTDLLAGQVAIMAANMLQAVPYTRNGRLRALGVTTANRVSGAPEIPTIAEAGLPGYESVQWYGLLAPAGTPHDVILKLNKESGAILTTAQARQRLAADGAEVVAGSVEEFAQYLKAEISKWAEVVRTAGIKPE